jgi:hypothetical protein
MRGKFPGLKNMGVHMAPFTELIGTCGFDPFVGENRTDHAQCKTKQKQ